MFRLKFSTVELEVGMDQDIINYSKGKIRGDGRADRIF